MISRAKELLQNGTVDRVLGWKREISFDALVTRMAQHDLELVRRETGAKSCI